MRCELCGHVFGQKHRITPGQWGGCYTPENVVFLCPNHHVAIHFLMRVRYRGPADDDGTEDDRLEEYRLDPDLMTFWTEVVEPIVIDRLISEERWEVGVRPIPLFPTVSAEHRHIRPFR